MKANENRNARKKATFQVTIIGIVVNFILSGLKIGVGLLGNSIVLVADGFHSASDFVSDAAVLLGVHIASHEPDENHPYGHGRFESLTTFFISVLLFVMAGTIIYQAIAQFDQHLASTPNLITMVAALISIVVKESLYQYTRAVGQKFDSRVLIANAWHHRSDAITSVAALIGIGGALWGIKYADAIMAIAVACIVGGAGYKIGIDALKELTDAAVNTTILKKIDKIVSLTSGVLSFHLVKARKLGSDIFVDVHIEVGTYISVSEGHHIAEAVRLNLKTEIPNIYDVLVHVDVEEDIHGIKFFPNREKIIALIEKEMQDANSFLTLVNVLLHYGSSGIALDIFFRVPAGSGIDTYQQQAELLGKKISKHPYITRVDNFFNVTQT